MPSFKLLCIFFLGVVATSLAASVSSENAVVDSDLSGEQERGFSKDSQGNDRCSCDNISCRCCVSPKLPKIGKISTCLRVVIRADQKSVGVQLSAKGRNLIDTQFNVGSRQNKCAAFPGSWNALQGCIDTDTSNLPNNAGIQTCPRIQLRTVGASIAKIILPCVQISNRRVSFNDRGEVKSWEYYKIQFF